MTKYKTGADENTSIIMNFPSTGAHGIATTNLRVFTSSHSFYDLTDISSGCYGA